MEFKFTIKTSKGTIIAEEIVNFPNLSKNWRNDVMELKAIHDYEREFLYKYIQTNFIQIEPTYGIKTNKCCGRCIEGLDKCIHQQCEYCEIVNCKCNE